MKRIIITLMLALGLAVSTPGVAQATGGNLQVNQYSSHSVYYRWGSANTLDYVNPGGSAPYARDVNYVQVANCWRLRYAFSGDRYTTTTAYNVYLGDRTIIVYDYYRVC